MSTIFTFPCKCMPEFAKILNFMVFCRWSCIYCHPIDCHSNWTMSWWRSIGCAIFASTCNHCSAWGVQTPESKHWSLQSQICNPCKPCNVLSTVCRLSVGYMRRTHVWPNMRADISNTMNLMSYPVVNQSFAVTMLQADGGLHFDVLSPHLHSISELVHL